MTATSLISSVTRRLDGRVALITEGASSIGEWTAKVFSQHVAKVIIADIQDELVNKAVTTTYGKLDIMFNNDGTVDENKARIIDSEKDDFERVLSINLTGLFLGIKHAFQAMIAALKGSILSPASISSYLGVTASHAYTCSKHAVIGLTKYAAVELVQFGIRVNCLSPYSIATPLVTKFVGVDDYGLENVMKSIANLRGVTLKAEDIANAVLSLASDESR
ncbi:secoisolariciresinol dehydrogenase-like [Quillaja saponaria]|uniref:Secoisolariciresinol dehydrogenase-like n=1 Tax=Quillaja saponaria TaxID=32244 RepID=A0AAD7PYP8_QUISA|nr:secoisolariciresinol dehydrogenase-like [Quillaja saponaria]